MDKKKTKKSKVGPVDGEESTHHVNGGFEMEERNNLYVYISLLNV